MASKEDLKAFLSKKAKEREEEVSTIDVKPVEIDIAQMSIKEELKNVKTYNNLFNIDFIDVDIEPLVIADINDKAGLLSNKIANIEDKYNVSVLPYECLQLPPNVKKLQRHSIIDLLGNKFTSGTTRIVCNKDVTDTIENIKVALENGSFYVGSLNTKVTIEGKEYSTIKFNIYELSYIRKLFIHYNPQITQTQDGKILLTIGKYDS